MTWTTRICSALVGMLLVIVIASMSIITQKSTLTWPVVAPTRFALTAEGEGGDQAAYAASGCAMGTSSPTTPIFALDRVSRVWIAPSIERMAPLQSVCRARGGWSRSRAAKANSLTPTPPLAFAPRPSPGLMITSRRVRRL
jgi:hypothetical protein